jgi:hypothetical protein
MAIPADLSASDLFRLAANTAAAIYSAPPPFVTYHVHTHASAPGVIRDTADERTVLVRTADDRAVVTDLANGRVSTGSSFPMPPIFDALASFSLNFSVSGGAGLDNFHVSNLVPMEFRKPQRADGTVPDVQVIYLRNYTAAYAEPPPADVAQPAHIVLTPTAVFAAAHPPGYLRDVFVDQTTLLPTRVDYTGPNLSMNVQYASEDGHWVVRGFELHTVGRGGPFGLLKSTVSMSATYDTYTFPATAPDPRLAP